MEKNILVTGCSGFIGYHLSNSLIKENKNVIGLDSLNNAYDVQLKQKRLEELNENENFIFLNENLTDQKSLDKLDEYKISTIYHFAAPPVTITFFI